MLEFTRQDQGIVDWQAMSCQGSAVPQFTPMGIFLIPGTLEKHDPFSTVFLDQMVNQFLAGGFIFYSHAGNI